MELSKAYKIGTVETLRVKSSGRRLYMNLDKDLVECYGIQVGDILRVKIEEGVRPENPGTRQFLKSVASPGAEEPGGGE